MAKKEVEVEVSATERPSSGPSMKAIIIVLVVVQFMMFGGLVAFLMMSGVLNQKGDQISTAKQSADIQDAIYISFEPAFTVNFGGAASSRFMQVTIEAMTYDSAIPQEISKHMPVIRNSIVLLLSSQSVESVSSLEGKEKLRKAILSNVQEILTQRVGKTGIEEIYFTSFVMQ